MSQDEAKKEEIPEAPETTTEDSNGRPKRARKSISRLEDERGYLTDALGLNRKKRVKKEATPLDYRAPKYKAKKVDEGKRLSANMIALQAIEKMSDESLKCNMSVLEPFISSKVHDRIQAAADVTPVVEKISKQPKSLQGVTMRSYQIEGLDWLLDHYRRGVNCILADEMGLGKTLQTISYFSYLKDHPDIRFSTSNVVEETTSVDEIGTSNSDSMDVVVEDSTSTTQTSLPQPSITSEVVSSSDVTTSVEHASTGNKMECTVDSVDSMKVKSAPVNGIKTEAISSSVSANGIPDVNAPLTTNGITERAKLGPYLVVVPLSVLFNWVAEMKRFCPSLRILRLHTNNAAEGSRLRDIINAADSFDVLITTYEMVKGPMEVTMRRILWTSMVLDEGHRIKNNETIISKTCRLFKARHKVILTGTPVQNNLHETFCLLNFLHPNVFDQSAPFEDCFSFGTGGQISVDRNVLDKAHYLLRPFVLRRIKTEVEQLLPSKIETLIECPMSAMQKFWSKRLLLKNSDLLQQFESSMNMNDSDDVTPGEEDPVKQGGAWKKLQSLLAQLRKAANHPFLFPDAEHINEDPDAPSTDERIVTASGKMVILDQLLEKLKKKGHRVVLFSQYTKTLDIISDYLDYRGYSFSRLDGQTNRVYREVLINQFNRKKSSKFIFCLSTRAGGEGVNLYTADTVILFDSDWNPQVDIQAMARVHRIGQKKTVHIYRLVSAGTVEERIVQRAQKKLFLDTVVNRGSTSKALELDELRDDSKGDNIDEEGDDVGMGAMMSALKFGWNSSFSFDGGEEDADADENIKFSDEMLNSIIDRKRGLANGSDDSKPVVNQAASSTVSVVKDATSKKKTKIIDASIRENQQLSAAEFEENAPMVDLRRLGSEVIGESAKAKSTKMKDIAAAWTSTISGKRQSMKRMESVTVEGVGEVNVLKVNQYSLEGGEPSVFEREAKGKNNEWAKDNKKKGPSFVNQDLCQVCFDHGDLLLCQHCPAAYHLQCCYLKNVPPGQWSCPHHQGCATCLRSCGAIGFTFRCEACASSFCEDCVPPDVEFLEEVERWDGLGFRYPRNCCYIRCSKPCITYMHGREKEARALTAQAKKEARQAKAAAKLAKMQVHDAE